MTMRFFRSDEKTYELLRTKLDDAWGHGLAADTITCYEPSISAPRDDQGMLVLAVDAKFCTFDAVEAVLPQMLASGEVEEIDEATYKSAAYITNLD